MELENSSSAGPAKLVGKVAGAAPRLAAIASSVAASTHARGSSLANSTSSCESLRARAFPRGRQFGSWIGCFAKPQLDAIDRRFSGRPLQILQQRRPLDEARLLDVFLSDVVLVDRRHRADLDHAPRDCGTAARRAPAAAASDETRGKIDPCLRPSWSRFSNSMGPSKNSAWSRSSAPRPSDAKDSCQARAEAVQSTVAQLTLAAARLAARARVDHQRGVDPLGHRHVRVPQQHQVPPFGRNSVQRLQVMRRDVLTAVAFRMSPRRPCAPAEYVTVEVQLASRAGPAGSPGHPSQATREAASQGRTGRSFRGCRRSRATESGAPSRAWPGSRDNRSPGRERGHDVAVAELFERVGERLEVVVHIRDKPDPHAWTIRRPIRRELYPIDPSGRLGLDARI